MFDPVDPKQSFPKLEHGILQYWKEEDIFKRSISKKTDAAHASSQVEDSFTFYDGPPFATGLPHYGHLLAGTIKDVIPRYQTMKGGVVSRRFGWDCHGLPVENLVEKEEGIKGRVEIEEKGVKWFNDKCRASVLRYTNEWRKTIERSGRWVDMDWDYRTMDPDYMESIWWVFSELHKKGLIYEGRKSMHVCPRCVTPLSNFEVTLGYKDVNDITATASFSITSSGKFADAKILAWTTTPWTLPGNVFLAVGKNIEYALVSVEGDESRYIAAKTLAEKVFKGKEFEIIETLSSKDLVGLEYKPLFSYFADEYKGHGAFRVVEGDFVTAEDGTGIVHIAPGFGEDDYQVGRREDVPVLSHVGMDGKFVSEVSDFAGVEVKPTEDPSSTDKKIVEALKEGGKLFARESYTHSYPHCWRCDSPLINYATSSWFVAVEQIKKDLLKSNAQTEWVPKHIRDGRFGNWLENARDWAISRNRYWGTPLPIWRLDKEDSNDIVVIGSRDELMSKCPIRFTKVTVMRHAESEGNLIPIYQGEVPGTDLTKRGRGQAKEAVKFFAKSNKPAVIYCSPLARTHQTAQIVGKKLGVEVIVDDRLREVHFGEYEGQTVDFSDLALVKERRALKIEKNKPESIYHFEGMETWDSVQERIENFMADTLPKHRGEHILVVSHADPVVNMKHFFTGEDQMKLSHQPYPEKATPKSYFWDHDCEAQMDLHKDTVDDVVWSMSSRVARPQASVSRDDQVNLTLVRHGQTDMNAERRAQGCDVDLSLNDAGRMQVEKLSKELRGEKFDVVISSNLKRAKETAAILAESLGIGEVLEWESLTERRLGEWSGINLDVLKEDNPIGFSESSTGSFHWKTPPGGETLSSQIRRVQDAIERLQKEYAGKRVLVVGHGGICRSFQAILERCSYRDSLPWIPNAKPMRYIINPLYRRIPDVLDCWFESGSMPYAQSHYPFDVAHKGDAPAGFPANFIAEGLDQTRGWFYTLMVLSSALFKKPAFKNCIVNGIVLAEDGKKMSKRLKNYPEPDLVMEKFGADAMRFTLMSSPAVRGETLRFSEAAVEESLRRVILPLWNTYSFFVGHANAAGWEPKGGSLDCIATPLEKSCHPLDQWIRTEVQDLVNRMTEELDRYNLSATCGELHDTIDALTNWYVRLSRRRSAGKDCTMEECHGMLDTLYEVLLTVSQLLAPFCPFITEAIYLNLVPKEHGSIHMTEWPQTRKLLKDEEQLLEKTRNMRTIVSLGHAIRGSENIKARQPLNGVQVALPARVRDLLTDADVALLASELNVKNVSFLEDPSVLADVFVQVDARKVGPRLGSRVQEIIRAGKEGLYSDNGNGTVTILDEKLTSDEAQIVYRGKEGHAAQSEKGIVVSLDTTITDELQLEGLARDVIRAVQQQRKEAGLEVGDRVTLLAGDGTDEVLVAHRNFIEKETNGSFDAVESKVSFDISIANEDITVSQLV